MCGYEGTIDDCVVRNIGVRDPAKRYRLVEKCVAIVDHLLAAQDAQMGADDGPRMASTFMARAEGSFSVPGAGLGAAE